MLIGKNLKFQFNHLTNDGDIARDLVKPLFNNSFAGGLANIFSAWLVYFLLTDLIDNLSPLYLSISISLIAFVRIALSRYFNKRSCNIRNALNGHILLTFLLGLCWGVFAYLQIQINDESARNILYLIMFGLIAGSSSTLSVWAPAYFAYIAPQTIGIFIGLSLINNNNTIYYAIAFLVFTLIMVLNSLRFHRSNQKQYLLTEELKDNRITLEKKVKSRTKELYDINNELSATCSFLSDTLEEKKVAESNLHYLAYHDELTGLPNLNLLHDRIHSSISDSIRNNKKTAVLFLDLDRFKTINDSMGHAAGDELLKEVAKRLKCTLRDKDTVSRNGGDEFIVVIGELDSQFEAELVAKKIISCIKKTFVINSHKMHVGVTIGISLFPGDGMSSSDLIKNSDTAMYHAKSSGGNKFHFYEKVLSQNVTERLLIEDLLHSALDNDEFCLFYQPQIDSTTNQVVGFEALLRWNNEHSKATSPALFIPILEEMGLIYGVGKWVINESVKFVKENKLFNLKISINLSPLQCSDETLIEYIKETLKKHDVRPELIEFEITESLLINDFKITKDFLTELHSIGCTIALDDFGTGYCSMSYLSRLPIDIIKIDQCFIRDIHNNETLKKIVKSLISLSEGIEVTNVFEGVETVEELKVINELGGNIIQGFLYSKPLDAKSVIEWTKANRDKSIESLMHLSHRKQRH